MPPFTAGLRRQRQAVTRVLLIGWDGADWKIINHLMDSGRMPNLARLVDQGVMGNLSTLWPDLSPLLWTSIATGQRPFKHGILGFIEPDPHSGGARPVTVLSRKTKALWNIFSQVGLKNIVVGWWPSHPAEPVNGVMVSNHYHRAVGPLDRPWPLAPGTIHPPRLVRNLAALRVHPGQLDAGHILPFVPRAAEVDQEKDRRLEAIARTIAEASSIQAATRALLIHEPWDFAAAYFDSVDHFCHGFMRYHPPRPSWVPETDFELYKEVVSSGYILHDIYLGQLLEVAGPEATVILVSDHGFHSDHLRPDRVPREPAGPAIQHRPHGILVMSGPGLKKDERIYGASLLDLAPTILAMYGLPVSLEMDGKVLVEAFESPPAIAHIPDWDQVPGPAGQHPEERRMDPVEARAALAQLVALGYIHPPSEDRGRAAAEAAREIRYNLARSYMDDGRHSQAAEILEELVASWPDQYRFGIQLVAALQALGHLIRSREVIEALIQRKMANATAARIRLDEFVQLHRDTQPGELPVAKQHELLDLRAEASVNLFAADYLLGSQLLAEGDEPGALECLRRAGEAAKDQPGLGHKIGETYLKMKRWAEAGECYRQALALDPDSAAAWLGLARSCLGRRRNAEAAAAALESVGLLYHQPLAHFVLGLALHRLGRIDRVIEALRVAVAQNPNFPQAHLRLAYIYRWRRGDPLRAKEHRMLAREAAGRISALKRRKMTAAPQRPLEPPSAVPGPQRPDMDEPSGGPVVVVSGLPRSGTSMLMQMLAAGGWPLLTDGRREADDDNPRGYYEFERVKELGRDASWVLEARGRAVKIIAQLLTRLPEGIEYRIIFMERDLAEVVRSQRTMLARKGQAGADISDERLAQIFARQVDQIKTHLVGRRIPTLYIPHALCLTRPGEAAARVNAFLGGHLDETAMARAVDRELYRHRS